MTERTDMRQDASDRDDYVPPKMETLSEDELRNMFPDVFAASLFSDIWNAIEK